MDRRTHPHETNRSTTRRAVLYVRLSVAQGADAESDSIIRQERDLREVADREGWKVVRVLADDGLSGRKARANADEALRLLASGDADVLLVWKFDRWSRQGIAAVGRLVEVLDATPGALFFALRDGLRSDLPAWRIIASVLSETARMEAENTSTRVAAAVRANKAAGRWTGGTPPLGYRSTARTDGPGRVLEVVSEEAEALADAARRIIDGASVYTVALALNEAGHLRPRRASEWSVQTLTSTLTGSAVVGRIVLDGLVRTGADGLPVQAWPAALPLDVWHAVRAAIAARAAARPVGAKRSQSPRARLLSGVVLCDACLAPLYVRKAGTTPNGRPGATTYACSARSNGKTCPGVAVTAERLEEHVTERFLGAFGAFPVLRPVEHDEPALELLEVEAALAEVERRLNDDATPDHGLDALEASAATLRRERRRLRADAADAPAVVTFEATGETYGDRWERAEVDERRALLASALYAVRVRKGRRGAHGLDPARVDIVFAHAHEAAEGTSRGPSTSARRAPRAERVAA